MSNPSPLPAVASPALFVGIDWADKKHDVCWLDANGRLRERTIEHSPEEVEALLAELRQLAGEGTLGVIVEKGRGALHQALMFREGLVLYFVDPKQFANYRKSFTSAGGKCDQRDAELLARFLRERHQDLKAWQPDDEATRRVALLAETRRQLVNEKTRLEQQLQAILKGYFPLVLKLGEVDSLLVQELLERWADPRQFRRAHPKALANLFRRHGWRNEDQVAELVKLVRSSALLTSDAPLIESLAIRVRALAGQLRILMASIADATRQVKAAFGVHPDAPLYADVNGAGDALAPRLLAAFGSDRERYADSDEFANVTGIPPITRMSGQSRVVVRRRGCSRFLKQTFHEFADSARKWCPWSKAYYQLQRSRGMRKHAALRKLAKCWIRILFKVWKTRTPYSLERHIRRLQATNHPLLQFMQQVPNAA